MTGIEFAAIASIVSTLKNLKDLTASSGNEIPQEVRDKIFEISDRFSSVQVQLLATLQHTIELTERCQTLQDDLNRTNDWKAQKARFRLQQVGKRTYVYALKSDRKETGEPEHWLCTRCFQAERESILQNLDGNSDMLTCLHCKYNLFLDTDSTQQYF